MKGWIKKVQQYSCPIWLFYTLLLIVGSLYPRLSEHYQTGEISAGLVPQEGDNFKAANVATVYRLEKGERRQYKDSESFFNHKKNKPYNTPYEQGGILICDKEVVTAFPRGNYMPAKEDGIGAPYIQEKQWEVFKRSLFRKDKIYHCIAYLLFAVLFSIYLAKSTKWSPFLSMLFVVTIGTLLGGSIEWIQFTFVPGRDKELLDMVFNTIGLLIGVHGSFRWIIPLTQKKEDEIYPNYDA